MIIKIDYDILKEQIALCHSYANVLKFKPLTEMFEGIANLLSEINCAVENGNEVYFEEVSE